MQDVAEESHLRKAVLQSLGLAQRTLERLEVLAPHWPTAQTDDGVAPRDKISGEASILLLIAHRVSHEHADLRPPVAALAQTLGTLVRGESARTRLLRSARSGRFMVIPHIMLTLAGHPDREFDELLRRHGDHPPIVECAAFRIAESRWLRASAEGTSIAIDDLRPFSIFASDMDPLEMGRMDFYSVTHWLMYASNFGIEPVPRWVRDPSVELLDSAIAWQIATEDLDLLGELLMGATMLPTGWSDHCVAAWFVLTATWEEFGFLPSPSFQAKDFQALTDEAKEAYAIAHTYHTQFVFGMLAALLLQNRPAEAGRRAYYPGPVAMSDLAGACSEAAMRGAAFAGDWTGSTARQVPSSGRGPDATWALLSAIACKGKSRWPFWMQVMESRMPEPKRSRVVLDALLISSVHDYDLDSIAKLLDLAIGQSEVPSSALLHTLRWLTRQQTPEGAIGAHFANPANIAKPEARTVTGLLSCLLDRAAAYLARQAGNIADHAAVEHRPTSPDGEAVSHRVVAAILSRGDHVLLCHRAPTRRWYPDVWDFPGGHVEDGERPEEALRRELTEEIGVDVGVVIDAPVLHLIDEGTGLDLTVWHITKWKGTVQNRQPEEHDEISWLAEAELEDLDFADASYLTVLLHILRAT